MIHEAVVEHRLTAVYGLFSGGHDSLASTVLAARHPLFAGAVHLNTGIGVEETRTFVRDTCGRQGWPLIELHAPPGRYEELVLERGGFPHGNASHNSMLFYLKQQPLRRWLRGVDGLPGLVTGIRKAESARRMGAGISVPVRKDGRKFWLSPILDWTKLDCGALIAAEGLPRNPVVDVLHRSGECLCGALMRPDEALEVRRWYPQVDARIGALERQCEERGIAASVWAGRHGLNVNPAQEALFSKAELAPLCTTCQWEAEDD